MQPKVEAVGMVPSYCRIQSVLVIVLQIWAEAHLLSTRVYALFCVFCVWHLFGA